MNSTKYSTATEGACNSLVPQGFCEVAEYEAARILGLELTAARQSGYDAIEKRGDTTHRLQIKGRCLLPWLQARRHLGSIDVEKDWDGVLLVLLDENFDAIEIHEAGRETVLPPSLRPGPRRGTSGALAVTKFKAIGT